MPRPVRILAALLAATTLGAAVTAIVASGSVSDRGAGAPLGGAGGAAFLLALASPAAVGLFVAMRRPGNRVAWILLAGPLSVTAVMAGDGLARYWLADEPDSAAGAWALLVSGQWPVIFIWPLALAFVYPDGRLPSRRWRVPGLVAAASATGALALLLLADPIAAEAATDVPNPLPVTLAADGPLVALFWICWAGLLASLVAGVLALRARYRAGGPLERRQVLWLAYGAVLAPLWLAGGSLLLAAGLPWPAGLDGVGLLVIQIWPAAAVAVSVTRHGLYAIDRLLSRTLVYAALTALLATAYGLVVLAAGAFADSALSASLATLVAALLFLPVRSRLQTAVDRRFARPRLKATRLLRRFAEDVHAGRAEPEHVGVVVAEALGDPRAGVVFRLPESGGYADPEGTLMDVPPDDGRARVTIGRDGREGGVLLHTPQPPPAPDVLSAVVHEAALPVELARLRVELRLQLAALAASRERIAQAGYAERRRIERDLHDGAQQRLVTLGIVLRRLQRSLPPDARLLVPALDSAVDEVAAAIGDLRTIAAGVRPPRLDEGLAAALADLARGAAVPVAVEASVLRAPPEVEAAAYYVACEALTNAVKHGAPSSVAVRTAQDSGVLRMVVEDDGVGGAERASTGTGLEGMRDRVAAQGGSFAIDSPPGAGTRIQVEFPCAS